jgi:hypothetical protein
MDTGGQATIEDGTIVIRVPIDALQHVVDGATALNGLDTRWLVTDPSAFAKEIVRSINDEDEQGTTRFHKMFDKAMAHAIEQGAEGVDEHPEQDF